MADWQREKGMEKIMDKKSVGIIHTTPATIAGLTALAGEVLGSDIKVVNILDDSILPDMMAERDVESVRQRWIGYARNLEQIGVSAVLSACSTVGEFAEEADRLLGIPVCRIDEAMAERAVEMGSVVSVFATLRSTLTPTVRLVERKAKASGREMSVNTVLVEGAYDALMRGDRRTHDQLIMEAVSVYMAESDVILLAQASMASAIPDACEGRGKILTSPRLGMEKLQKLLNAGASERDW